MTNARVRTVDGKRQLVIPLTPKRKRLRQLERSTGLRVFSKYRHLANAPKVEADEIIASVVDVLRPPSWQPSDEAS